MRKSVMSTWYDAIDKGRNSNSLERGVRGTGRIRGNEGEGGILVVSEICL